MTELGNLNLDISYALNHQAHLLLCEIVSQIKIGLAQTYFWPFQGLPTPSPPPPQRNSFQVFCDMEANGGGWTLIQRRENGSVNFQRNWRDYKQVTLLPWEGAFKP